MAYLEIQLSGERPLRFELVAPRTTLGRSSGCDISLPDPAMSRVHLEVYHRDGHYIVRDLGSRNGTLANGDRVRQPRPLTHLDQILVGKTRAVFFAEDESSRPENEGDGANTASVSLPAPPALQRHGLEVALPTMVSSPPRTSEPSLSQQLIKMARRLNDVGEVYRQLRLAHRIQKALLPRQAPEIPGYRLFADTHPCDAVGGDFFDYLELPGGLVAFVIGDVSGHGVGAALLAHYAQASIRTALRYESDLERLVGLLNDDILRHSRSNQFVTACLCILDPTTGDLTYVNAAQCSPLAVESEGNGRYLDGSNLMIGAYPSRFKSRSARLLPNSTIVLYSDGYSECRNERGDEYGEARLLDFFSSRAMDEPERIARELEGELEEFVGPDIHSDDQTLMLLQRLGS